VADRSLPADLAYALDEARARVAELSDRAGLLLTGFCDGPQLRRVNRIYPVALKQLALLPMYARYVHQIGEALDLLACVGDAVGGDGLGLDFSWGARSAAWLICAQAAQSAGYPVDDPGRAVLVYFEGVGELCALADDPVGFSAGLELVQTWEGSAGALACAVRLGTSPVRSVVG
jgi:hypothetical protein